MLMVFCHHITLFHSVGAWDHLQRFLKEACGIGHAGVDLFFVLSGFLITSMLLREQSSASYYHDFYWKRALRVLPLYILVLALLLALVPHSFNYVLLAFFFLANFASVFHLSLATPFWSLAVEEQFYLIWPAVLRRRTTGRVAQISLGVALASFLLRAAFAWFHHYNYYLTFLHCDGLALGALLASFFRRSQEERKPFAIYSSKLAWILCVGILLASCVQVIQPGSWFAPYFLNLELTGITLTCCGAIGLCIAHTNSPKLRILRAPALTFFGMISYAFYVVHLFVIQAYDRLSPVSIAGNDTAYVVRLFVTFAISCAVSLLSRYAIELPALSLRRRVLSRPVPLAETELRLTQLS